MDLGNLLITGIIIVAIAIPFILWAGGKKKKSNKYRIQLDKLAAGKNTSLKNYQIYKRLGFALDTGNKYVFYTQFLEDTTADQIVDLSGIASCELIKTEREKVVDRLALRFVPKTKNVAPTVLEVFDVDEDMHMGSQLEALQEWLPELNAALRN